MGTTVYILTSTGIVNVFDRGKMVSFDFHFSDYNDVQYLFYFILIKYLVNFFAIELFIILLPGDLYHHLLCHLVFLYLFIGVSHILRIFCNIFSNYYKCLSRGWLHPSISFPFLPK